MKNLMKISLVLPDLAGGGAERVNLDLAYEFKQKGFEVEIVLKKARGAFVEEASRSFKVVDLNTSSNFKFIFKLSFYIKESKPDLVIVSMWGLTAFSSFSKLITKHKYKLLLVEHSSLTNQFKKSRIQIRLWLKLSTFLAYRIADEVAGVSSGVAQDIKKIANLKKTPLTLYNPIPITKLKKSDFTKKSDCKIVVAAGRLIDAKDYPTLISAFAIVSSKVNLKLIILGDGPLRNELELIVEHHDLKNKVVFKGFVDSPRDYFIAADLFVLSSKREGFGNVIVESLGTGTPVVSTNCEHGPAEILNNGEFGELVPVGDAQALADAMYRSLTSVHNSEKLINRAKDFTPEIVAKNYLDVLGYKL